LLPARVADVVSYSCRRNPSRSRDRHTWFGSRRKHRVWRLRLTRVHLDAVLTPPGANPSNFPGHRIASRQSGSFGRAAADVYSFCSAADGPRVWRPRWRAWASRLSRVDAHRCNRRPIVYARAAVARSPIRTRAGVPRAIAWSLHACRRHGNSRDANRTALSQRIRRALDAAPAES